jgi:hypothetical protein
MKALMEATAAARQSGEFIFGHISPHIFPVGMSNYGQARGFRGSGRKDTPGRAHLQPQLAGYNTDWLVVALSPGGKVVLQF